MLVSFLTLIATNAVDAVITRMALKKAYQEKSPLTRKMIDKFDLDTAMIIKFFLPMILVPFVIVGWDNVIFSLWASILFIALTIFFSVVVIYDVIQLLKSHEVRAPVSFSSP
jgi:hypothetical protein